MRLLIVLALSAAAVPGIEPGKASVTAVLTLHMRALGAKVPDAEVRNPDTLAWRFLGSAERQVFHDFNQPVFADLDFAAAWEKMSEGLRRLFLHVLARTRVIDDAVEDALRDGARQLVILGAGYDTRAYRLSERLRRVTVFEVDFPPTQELKKARVRQVIGSIPKNVVFVAMDFTKEDLGTVLRRAGYRSGAKTLFIWEGVSFYLPAAAVEGTLRFVAHNSAPGSIIVFDYESDRAIKGDHDDRALAESMAWLAKVGEPHVFGLPIGGAQTFLRQHGLAVEADRTPEELTRRYLTRKDGSKLGEAPWHYALCVARVPSKTAARADKLRQNVDFAGALPIPAR
jgi:methyltransferase (TIGR00027 family)